MGWLAKTGNGVEVSLKRSTIGGTSFAVHHETVQEAEFDRITTLISSRQVSRLDRFNDTE